MKTVKIAAAAGGHDAHGIQRGGKLQVGCPRQHHFIHVAGGDGLRRQVYHCLPQGIIGGVALAQQRRYAARGRLGGGQAGEKITRRHGIVAQGEVAVQHQSHHGPAAAPTPFQTRQHQPALLRFKRIQAADAQILPSGLV